MKERPIVRSLAFLFLLLLTANSSAEQITLNLEKAKEYALVNNPAIKLARESLAKANAQVIEARSGLMPQVSGFSSLQHAWELPTMILNLPPAMGGQQKFKMGTENNIAYGISVNQPVYMGGAIWSGLRISQNVRDIAKQQLESTEANILSQVTSAYYGVLFAGSTVDVSAEALESAEMNLEQVNNFFNAGKSSRFDVLRAEVQVANFKPMLVSAKNNYRLAETQLLTVLGLEQETEVEFLDRLQFIEDGLIHMSLDELIEIAVAQRPEMIMMDSQEEIARQQLGLARSAYLPAIMFGTNYQYQGMRDDFDFTNDDFYKSFNSTVSLSIPLFQGLKTSSKLQQAKIGIKEVRHQEESLRDGIELEVKAAYYKMKEAHQNVRTQEKTIEQAQEAQRLANLMYSEGASTQLDVLNANLSVNQAKMNYQKSVFDYYVAISQLKKAINQL